MAAAAAGGEPAWGEEPAARRRPKTKIVCTLGPASRSVEMISRLLRVGMCVARFNFSHGSHEYHQETLDNLRAAMERTGILCAVMLDTKGPEIRTGFLKDAKPVQLKKGQEITISTDYSIKGDEKMISMSYKKLAVDLKPGSVILCADGTITLTVLHCDKEQGLVRCRCENTSMLGERKNVNLPGVIVDLPTLTDKDKEDILKWGVPNKIDMIALSFVRKGSDLVEVRKILGEHAKSIMLMSKVENQEGVANFDDILANSDAFMVARGDLGMEIPIEKIFFAQKVMIFKCNIQGKPVVTATQMLESMIKSPRPTRAEATDVANAVLDGTDCVMLSGETAAGAYPELAVQTMAKICLQAESCVDYGAVFKLIMASAPIPMSPLESLASSAVRTANSARAVLILVLTRGGTTARLVAKYRPSMPILSVVVPELKTDSFDWTCSDEGPARQSLIVRGVIPMLSAANAKAFDSEATEEALGFAIENAKVMGLCNTGESVVALHRIGIASVIKLLTVRHLPGALAGRVVLQADRAAGRVVAVAAGDLDGWHRLDGLLLGRRRALAPRVALGQLLHQSVEAVAEEVVAQRHAMLGGGGAASGADEEAPAERRQLVALDGDAGGRLQALQLALPDLVQEPQERGDAAPAPRQLVLVPVVDVSAAGLRLAPAAAAAGRAVARAEDGVRPDGARAVRARVHFGQRAAAAAVGRGRAAGGLHLLEEAAVAVRALHLRLALCGPHRHGPTAQMAAAAPTRAPVSSSSSDVVFSGRTSRPNLRAAAVSSAPGWRRREPYPAVSVAAGSGQSAPGTVAVDPKVDTLLDSVKWDSKGLAVAIAQHVDTGAILMQGFANKEALAKTISTRKATFFSRSRSSLWTKGETSMNFINVHDIFLDCDRDSIIYLGKPDGPTCHTGAETCYYTSVYNALQGSKPNEDRQVMTTLYSLEDTISRRQEETVTEGSGKPSWTKKLLLDNQLLCSKIREEAGELIQTLLENEDQSRTASEMADLLYHAMVLLRVKDVKMEEVLEVLRKRFSQSGIEEKANRNKS
ncbi:uncharacterized protein LOC101758684 [Setaria italica]|uniref:uncharacterized protein LOC101758684 n=1 Tax=Setaria italica TaxID=4555 RepID=UPI000BE5C926|nr:uncharacterized protein LOC101758684 [Setaria italica]